MRALAFPNAAFGKDNDASSGTKGDYVFRDFSDDGVEYISIMFEMKNEADTSSTKKKNADFLAKLDKDRGRRAASTPFWCPCSKRTPSSTQVSPTSHTSTRRCSSSDPSSSWPSSPCSATPLSRPLWSRPNWRGSEAEHRHHQLRGRTRGVQVGVRQELRPCEAQVRYRDQGDRHRHRSPPEGEGSAAGLGEQPPARQRQGERPHRQEAHPGQRDDDCKVRPTRTGAGIRRLVTAVEGASQSSPS